MARTLKIPDPTKAAKRELRVAVWELVRGLLSVPDFWLQRAGLCARIRDSLQDFPAEPAMPALPDLKDRALTIVISCAEASGEQHAARLARELTAAALEAGAPAPRLLGFGGAELQAAGVTTLADPGAHATMDAGGALAQLPYYQGLLETLAKTCLEERPDVFVPVDSPALHVPMASIAQRYGVPVVHHITPQYWAWAPWRVRRYRQVVDLALTILPFESAWFDRHNVRNAFVGHPIRDAHAERPEPPGPDGRDTILLLPGSRAKEIEDNLPFMLAALDTLRAAHPDVAVRVTQRTAEHESRVRALLGDTQGVTLSIGDLEGDLGRARAALAVSGTVLTEVAHHSIPTAVLYRVTKRWKRALRSMLTVPWFSGINLVAGEEVLPEFAVIGDDNAVPLGKALIQLYEDGPERTRVQAGLVRAMRRLGEPGAAQRAARHVLGILQP
jgi:lipid-A-disaccharide synthase